jgi:predicted transposase/invertase (TIGR01784 family)
MSTQKKNIRFDWAMKRLLRNKADHKVLEGFLSELLREDILIKEPLEAEGNQDFPDNKFNRVDILVENTKGELFIIEMQNSSEPDYLLRMLYGTSRVITNHIQLGEAYINVRKVFSINIVYFELGQGQDYVYHGKGEFLGIHQQDVLELTARQKEYFGKDTISALYPEYYIIKVNDFDNVAKDTLDEWIYYFKNNVILDTFKAKGLPEARKVLIEDNMSPEEYEAYRKYLDLVLFEKGALKEAEDKGIAEGEYNKAVKVIVKGHKAGMSVDSLAAITDLSPDQVTAILKEQGII